MLHGIVLTFGSRTLYDEEEFIRDSSNECYVPPPEGFWLEIVVVDDYSITFPLESDRFGINPELTVKFVPARRPHLQNTRYHGRTSMGTRKSASATPCWSAGPFCARNLPVRFTSIQARRFSTRFRSPETSSGGWPKPSRRGSARGYWRLARALGNLTRLLCWEPVSIIAIARRTD